jgi:glycine/D-amino acid oxidase-like deaminating enzyme
MSLDRRDFLKLAGVQAGALLALPRPGASEPGGPALWVRASEVVVVGAGVFGVWTAFHLRRMGASVTLVDMYGPGNSRATSGDETRGIRSSYSRESWVLWAKEAIKRWSEWDAEWSKPLKHRIFFPTGDIVLRTQEDGMIRNSRANWDKHGFKYEILTPDEIRYRFPQIRIDGVTIGMFEPDAGVARARRSVQLVADVFLKEGGKLVIAQATPGAGTNRRMGEVSLSSGSPLRGDMFVFACGPWLGKVFPEVMGRRLRTPIGQVYYFATPPGDGRFTFPNCPSWNVPGVTGWPALGVDNRGFRVRGGGGRPVQDPDTSVRWVDSRYHEGARNVLNNWFPDLAKQPLLETRACHYEGSPGGNFIIDKHPDFDNVWIAGAGNAESFKMGPVSGEYIAKRVLGKTTDPELDAEFKIPEATFDAQPSEFMRARRVGIGQP